ncbi:8299_t:CDS:2 [Scutellospora calospora]|uniref:8299_t:CDS:1 n=1 Tax=Scutellospora calospora TaxID=85575 RepID=A0ACA9JV11_9GLOM|nr:8299_t:CDS:2 [Scutellospora calospora]
MGNCVACIIEIHNNTDLYLLRPYKNHFSWGRLEYETEENDILYPNQISIKGVQGRTGSISGVQDYFIYDVVNRNNNTEIGQVKLIFDVPYDTNRFSRSTKFEITNYSDEVDIKIKTDEKWSGYGFGNNLCKFIITYEIPNRYSLRPFDNEFKWGYLKYKTDKNDIIYPRQTSIKIVQGRENSMSGVQGSFTYDVVERKSNNEIARIKLLFDIPFDTNRYSKAAKFEIIEKYTDDEIFRIETVEEWSRFGYGKNKCKFIIINNHFENPITKDPIIETKSIKKLIKNKEDKKDKYKKKEKFIKSRGYLKYETEGKDIIYPRQKSVKIVQGQIKLILDVPFDSNLYSRSIDYKITNYSDIIIKVETNEEWGGYGFGESKCKFTITNELAFGPPE